MDHTQGVIRLQRKSPEPIQGATPISDPAAYMEENGLIGYLNVSFFHPCGLRLVMQPGGVVALYECGDHPTAVLSPEEFADYMQKFARFQKNVMMPARKKREEQLAFYVQNSKNTESIVKPNLRV